MTPDAEHINDFAQYVAETLSSAAASDKDTADFVLRIEDNQIAYVGVEDCTVWLITVNPARFEVAE